MEAPTPVSALLHAGVVNIGGFVLIRLAALDGARRRRAGCCSCASAWSRPVVAALVMTTRVSVKVALAWSTCAQMGFMLVQCGLGAVAPGAAAPRRALALQGPRLPQRRGRPSRAGAPRRCCAAPPDALAGRHRPRPRGPVALASAPSPSCARAAAGSLALPPAADRSVLVLAILVALVPLALARQAPGLASTAALAAARGRGRAAALRRLARRRRAPGAPGRGLERSRLGARRRRVRRALRGQGDARHAPAEGRLARALYPWLFAGLYLDERFTRFTFRVWPPRFQPCPIRPSPHPHGEPLERPVHEPDDHRRHRPGPELSSARSERPDDAASMTPSSAPARGSPRPGPSTASSR